MSTPEDTFREEASELLAVLESSLLELEDQPDDAESVDQAFRAMHTIKGSGAMFGFDKLSAFTHHLENAFDLVRSGDLDVTKDLINIALGSGDHIRNLLNDMDPSPGVEAEGNALLEQLSSLLPGNTEESTADNSVQPKQKVKSGTELDATWRIRITPAVDTLVNGMDPLPVLRELVALGPCHVTTMDTELPPLSKLDPESCYLIWDLILTRISHQ